MLYIYYLIQRIGVILANTNVREIIINFNNNNNNDDDDDDDDLSDII